jgi:hypothetical protein
MVMVELVGIGVWAARQQRLVVFMLPIRGSGHATKFPFSIKRPFAMT